MQSYDSVKSVPLKRQKSTERRESEMLSKASCTMQEKRREIWRNKLVCATWEKLFLFFSFFTFFCWLKTKLISVSVSRA